MKHRHIVFEGAIGAGKTSLATRLAQRLGAATLLEEPSANPFLPLFYRDMRRHALPTQLFIVNSDRLDFVDNQEHLDLLEERIRSMRGGREFFNVR